MQENNPREIELNFNNSEECIAEMQEARAELFNELAQDDAVEVADVPAGNPDELPMGNDLESELETATVVSAAVPESPVLRSRHPANCPPGTPPLEPAAATGGISAAEKAVAGKSYGAALLTLRELHNVSYKDLEAVTLIQPRYLEALENEDLEALPPLVYVIAHIRSLCRYYNLSSSTSDALVKNLKENLEYSCNDEFINTLDIDSSGAEANERKIKKIIGVFLGLLLLLVAGVALVLFLIFRTPDKDAAPVSENVSAEKQTKKFDPNTIYHLLEPPTLDLPKLPVAE